MLGQINSPVHQNKKQTMTEGDLFEKALFGFLGFTAPSRGEAPFIPTFMTKVGPGVWYIETEHGGKEIYFDPCRWQLNADDYIVPTTKSGLSRDLVEVATGRKKRIERAELMTILLNSLKPLRSNELAVEPRQKATDVIPKDLRMW